MQRILFYERHARCDILENNPYRNNKCMRMHLTETVASTKILSGARLFSLPINNVVNRYRLLLVEV